MGHDKQEVEHYNIATNKIKRSLHVHIADLQTADRAVDDDSQGDKDTAGVNVHTCSQARKPGHNLAGRLIGARALYDTKHLLHWSRQLNRTSRYLLFTLARACKYFNKYGVCWKHRKR